MNSSQSEDISNISTCIYINEKINVKRNEKINVKKRNVKRNEKINESNDKNEKINRKDDIEICKRCFRFGHSYNFCSYNVDINNIKLPKKSPYQYEYFNQKFIINSSYDKKCPRCHQRKHINRECGKSIFIYLEDLD